ncbi:N-acetyltransferase [Streptomyces millisiae]|uniref:N-acetyltransferase n=1 Tax=Streptomyces millisiae TaxID=3075542 RepID=A0ABU2LH88_9ACTN|nr:N-acetyltransferase [Streptomyces sp. DSM 44918]MDT0316950.1 N-acetyltransferase [Streptomyces sp. DSM 44918]
MAIVFAHLLSREAPGIEQLYVRLHTEVWGREFGLRGERHSPRRVARRLAVCARRPGWSAVVGYEGSVPVGYCHGYTLEAATSWWSDLSTPSLGPAEAQDGCRTAVLEEIVVRRPWRRRGVGRCMHDAWLSRRAETRVTLQVKPDAGAGSVQALYHEWGYRDVGRRVPVPGSGAPELVVMLRSRITPLDS